MSLSENKSAEITDPSTGPELLEPATQAERDAFHALEPARLPRHVAIIMDGNGRWAKSRSMMERIEGHRAGIDSVRAAVRTAAQLKLTALTLYAFSSENWSRPKREIMALMNLLETFLVRELPELMDNNIRLVASGTLGDLPESARRKLDHAIAQTASNSGTTLNLALSYGGRRELADAMKRIAEGISDGRWKPEDVNESLVAQNLYQPHLPEPELLIRTSGEQRVSNFLLWQIAYTEFVYLDILWPDFRRIDFLGAVLSYQKRDRRFGKV